MRLGCANTALRGEKKKKGIKSKSQQLVHEDILIDAKNAYIVYLHLVVFSESCFKDFSVFFDLQTGKIFEIFFFTFLDSDHHNNYFKMQNYIFYFRDVRP